MITPSLKRVIKAVGQPKAAFLKYLDEVASSGAQTAAGLFIYLSVLIESDLYEYEKMAIFR